MDTSQNQQKGNRTSAYLTQRDRATEVSCAYVRTVHCWCQKTRVIVLSCGIKLSALCHLALSRYTHLTDGQTDRIATAIPCVALHSAAR